MTVYSSVTGAINIYGERCNGRIFFQDGQPYQSAYGTLRGLDAVAAMFEEGGAKFAFVSDISSDEENLWGDPLDMVDNAERLAARWRQVHPVVPHMQLIAQQRVALEVARCRIAPDHWAVYVAIDSQRTLEDLAGALNWEAVELCEAIAQMVEDGVVELREPRSPAAQGAGESAGAGSCHPKVGLLDRLLATLPPIEPMATPVLDKQPGDESKSRCTSTEEGILRLLRQ